MPVQFLARIILICALALILGCASTPPSNFYILNSLKKQETQQQGSDAMQHVAIGIGSIEIPDYLDRSQMVIRSSHSELKVDEFNRWAGSLKENILQVLAENLSLLLSTDGVFAHPWMPDDAIKYWLHVEIIHLDVIPAVAIEASRSKLSRTPARAPAKALTFGCDNRRVLGELLGFSDEAIAALDASGVLS